MPCFLFFRFVIAFALLISTTSVATSFSPVFTKIDNTSLPVGNTVVPASSAQAGATSTLLPNLTLTGGVTAIAAGYSHTCALTSAGVKCWGNNYFGQLGDGTTAQRLNPVNVSGLTNGTMAIATGSGHTCALTNMGSVKCWGGNSHGQLGNGTTIQRLIPVDVNGLTSGVTAIAAGYGHTCALMDAVHGGGVKCWGDNYYGELGDGTTTDRLTPVNVSGLTSGVMAIAAGWAHTCALTSTGGVKCWGGNPYGELGDGTTTWRLTPVNVSGLTSGVMAIAAGLPHTCAVMDAVHGSGAKCWGGNGAGELGDGTKTQRLTPVDVSGLTDGVMAIAAGWAYTCALTNAGGVKCWGDNTYGELGDGTTTQRLTPVDVGSLTSGAMAIAVGGYHTCALTNAGSIKCWGQNESGQLGDGTTTNRLTPIDVVGLNPIVLEAQADVGMPYPPPPSYPRGCPSDYVGCGKKYHGFDEGVCTDLVLDAYNAGVPFNIQNALRQDYLAHKDRYGNKGWARNSDDMRHYFIYNQQFLPHNQAYQVGDIAFFDWNNDKITNHVLIISDIDTNGRPLKMVDASDKMSGNPSGNAWEHSWNSSYDKYVQGHGRLNSALEVSPVYASAVNDALQVLRVTVNSPSATLRLHDANGKSTSAVFDDSLVASNNEAFIPYIPYSEYVEQGDQRVISVTWPLSNTAQYFIEVTGNTATQYQMEIQTLEDGALTASTSFTQSITLGETQGITVQLSAPSGVITFTASTPMSIPTVVVSPTEIQMSGQSGITATATVTLTEIGNQQALNDVSVAVSNLMNQAGQVITGTLLTVAPASFDVPAGGSQGVQLEMNLANMELGVYQASLVITSANGGTRSIPLSLSVEPFRVFLPLTLKSIP